MSAPEPPAERLAGGVRWLWRTQGLLVTLAVLAAGQALAGPVGVPALGAWAALVVGALAVGARPELLWRRWRIALDDERLDLRHGAFTVRRTLVPMRRVQHVDAASDVLERCFSLATVTVHTAGGQVEVPGLPAPRAAALARRIAELARVDDD